MGLLQNLIKGVSGEKTEFKQKLKEAEMDMKINKSLEEKSKSANKRELERYIKEKEESDIKVALEKIRKQQTKENWKGTHKLLGGKANMMKTDRPILKEKNIFVDKRNDIPFTKKGDMFFKW
jgi:hypothetical protein